MTIQDHSNSPNYSTLQLDAAVQTMVEGHVTKIRKQYTISKQREKWTEEEHKKFLEALKLYGRAWRKIEEHVGTKTAVQIRSHAQKFFSKVVRESKNNNSSLTKTMEIPPPRPKRKPMHPYPRKLVIPAIKDVNFQEQSMRSTSPNSSVDQENQSPTSVLSENGHFEDSSTPEGSSSPISHFEDEPVSVKLELSTSPKFLKLFGKTMLLEDPETKSAKLIGPSAPVPSRFIQLHCINFIPGSVNVPDNSHMDQNKNECSSLRRARSEKYSRAFVPYKRSLSEKCNNSSAINGTVLLA